MVALAVAAMPSSRPVKPSRSLVVAFTATREMSTPVISAIRARMASRNGTDLRPLADQRDLEIGDASAARGDAVDRIFQEAVGRRALPLGIARRKVRADIAVGQRAEDGVDQRVQADIAVGMGEKASGVRHAHAADHQMIAVAEGMHVVAGAGPDIAEHCSEARFLANEIFGCRQFHVRRIAFKCRHRQSRPFRERRIVGEIVAALARRAAMGVENHVDSETPAAFARCASARAPASPRHCRSSSTSLIVSVTGIAGTAAPVRPAASIAREISAGVTKGRAASWIRTMSGFWLASASSPACTEAWRVAPPFAGGSWRKPLTASLKIAVSSGLTHRLHGKDLGMAAERLHGPEDHGLAADHPVLLRSAGAGAKPAAGCDKDGCGTLGFRHVTSGAD